MWLADFLLPGREDRFIALLIRQTQLLTQVAHNFRTYMVECSPAVSAEIDQLERAADDVLRDLTTALRDTFVTPLDRQDIYNLGEAIDDMIDYLNNAAREIAIFRVSPTPHVIAISETLADAAEAIAGAVTSLRSDQERAWGFAREAQHAENLVEERYRNALAELFEGDDVHTIFKLREVYRHLSNSADRADAIGRLIGKIVVKTT